jgi:predicted secreted hydrolase
MKNKVTGYGLRVTGLVLLAGAALIALFLCGGQGWGAQEAEWRQAIEPWKWAFPKDHGSHPAFRTEWWYFTGNLFDTAGKRYGYQLTFFRQGVALKPLDPTNPWSIRDLYLAHFTLTDASAGHFSYGERLSRKGPGLAGSAEGGMQVRLLNWSAKMVDNTILLEARHQDMELSVRLTPRKPLVLHGEHGLSKKGPKEGQASYYYSYTDLQTEGVIRTSAPRSSVRVQGTSWFDHEFGSNQLGAEQVGWDWFSLHLSDGQDLMIYLLRRKDGTLEPASSGTLVDGSGRITHLKLPDIGVEVLGYWKSARSAGAYPNKWRITIRPAHMDLVLAPLVANQELATLGSTGVTYWEGAVGGTGASRRKSVTCEGYVEMTGYAGSMSGIF